MELMNLLFAVLLGFVVVTGFLVFYADIAGRYNNVAAADPLLTNLSIRMNATAQSLESTTNTSIFQATAPTRNLDLTAAVFGYVTGAINAIGTIMGTPALFLDMIAAMGATIGFFIPPFILLAINAAVYVITLIGLLYFLLKVK